MIIAIEGIDGSGKTTLAKLLAHELGATYLKFPDRDTPSGKLIGEMLTSGFAHTPPLAFQALQLCNRVEKLFALAPARLHSRVHCICDRYTMSSLVYGQSDGIDRTYLERMNAVIPKADYQILLSPDPTLVDKDRLAGRDREEYERRGLKGLVAQALRFRVLWAERGCDPRWMVFDNTDRTPFELAQSIAASIDERIQADGHC